MVPFEEDEEMLTLEDAAQRFGVDVPTVVDWCHKGNLPAKRIGGSWRVQPHRLGVILAGSRATRHAHGTAVRVSAGGAR